MARDKKEIKLPEFNFDARGAIAEGEEGLRQAVQNAEWDYPGWRDTVYAHFIKWLYKKGQGYEFFIETFRKEMHGIIQAPPSNRAYGFLAQKAQKDKLIRFLRIDKTTSKTAHGANASVWKKL